MIIFQNNVFHASTKNTSYIIRVRDGQYIEQLYYGKKIRHTSDYEALYEKNGTGYGNSIVTPTDSRLTLDNICLEYSFSGTGDYRHIPLTLQMPDSCFSNQFVYDSYRIYQGTYEENDKTNMPFAKKSQDKEQEDVETLDIVLKDTVYPVYLHLIYTFFYECDVIVRLVKIENHCEDSIRIEKVMSMMLDLPEQEYYLHTFDGLWIRERHKNRKKLVSGIYVNDSTTGSSSNRHNPFIMLTKANCTQDTGDCFGFNLIYSGNHYEAVEVSEYGKIRIMSGLNPHQFAWTLDGNDVFYTPQAVLTYSDKGQNGLSHNMHVFVNQHIIPSNWQGKERPIVINNWEATYFDFTGDKLLEIAEEAKSLGIEMFVLDDGWFSNRNDDTSSLGDWTVNEKKIGGTLDGFVKKINNLGIKFGLWFEPEMICEISELYRQHPDWAVKVPGREAYLGRNQLVLDLTRQEVCEYIVDAVTSILKSAPVEYVKWDMNRHITDAYSAGLLKRQGEFYHRYILGLYQIMKEITEEFPDVLFESCSSGGNRFDLGMLFYMPQIWTSDNTDANQRIDIQEGTSFGYPLSAMAAHVSAVPNHQTLRNISIETRFHVACFGVLGYEIDITKLTEMEKIAVAQQISFYKQYRRLFQFGTFSRLKSEQNLVVWQVTSGDQKEAVILVYQRLAVSNPPGDIIKAVNLLPDEIYTVKSRKQYIIKGKEEVAGMSEEEEYQVFGDMLMHAGIKLVQQFSGTELLEQTRLMGDFGTRVYEIKKK
ncbi:alpha-galactosidase [Anaeromicropila populeti]|uniref:Alpha-galactosidase n=1 Tax=Anaeromicropila populeti TaxID=37658 RepID=A0A1I6IPV3_9FIRM|nr:alpha-galactosidase [Anaeromicropila populeti]SFR68777.1 alpha-galactosidase [Anaeromicropila populeti]